MSRRSSAVVRNTFQLIVEPLEDRSLPSVYSSAVLADGPLAYWRLDETAATSAVDSSGHGHTGTYMNSPALGQSSALLFDSNTAAGFDGVNDFVYVDNLLGGNFTLEVWVRTSASSLTGTQAYQGNGILWSDVAGDANDYILANLNNHASFFTGNPDGSITGTTALNDGNWHHLVATRFQGGATALYVDGILEASGVSGGGFLNANAFMAIGGNTLDSRYFNGDIDEVAVYGNVLSAAQVMAHYLAAVNPGQPIVNVGSDATINVSDTFTQPGNFTHPASGVYSATVDYGDGSGVQPLALNADRTFNLAHAYADDGSYTVHVVVTDPFGNTGDASLVVTALAVAPTAAISGPSAAVRGQPVSFTFSATDSSSADRAAGFTYQINWGDGNIETVAATSSNGAGVVRTHVYQDTSAGYQLQVTATDEDGLTSTIKTQAISISAVALQSDPLNPGALMLVVGGTDGADFIRVTPAAHGQVRVWINFRDFGLFDPTSRIIVHAQGGSDFIILAGVKLHTWVFGGSGFDLFVGGRGHNVFIDSPRMNWLLGRG